MMLPLPPKVVISAAVKVGVVQLVPETVAVLVTVAPVVALVKVTVTLLAPEMQVPVAVAVAPVTSDKLMMLLAATLVMTGVATDRSMVAAVVAVAEV